MGSRLGLAGSGKAAPQAADLWKEDSEISKDMMTLWLFGVSPSGKVDFLL